MTYHLRITARAMCLLGLDDPLMRDEMGLELEHVRSDRRGTVYAVSSAELDKLEREVHARLTNGGYHYDNPGAAATTLRRLAGHLTQVRSAGPVEPKT